MMYFVYGGSASGKSEYAENLLLSIKGDRKAYYIATMKTFGTEGEERVRKHRKLREGKGFITIECPKALDKIKLPEEDVVAILEDVSNLAANMFFEDGSNADDMVEQIFALNDKCAELVVVGNNIFEDGCDYDEQTLKYIETVAELNTLIAANAVSVEEIVCSLVVKIK